jgi:hypothetical protein
VVSDTLASWRDTATRQAIENFVASAARDIPPDERVAVFDNDGTLWCEKPMPIELGFVLQRLAEMAQEDASLRGRQPWQSAYERDYEWLGGVVTKHYAGDDSDVKVLMGASSRRLRDGPSTTMRRPQAPSSEMESIPLSAASSFTASTNRWSSCSGTWRPTGS